ncbi:hypothetical protein [Providencia rustigianii]|uniref:hypothetical protein n=1 Tax=Providencia rustigianii TaxID=158850 RepID=UPI000D8675B2|nr:hypothetical protein [Providencia rustigianii]SPY78292.1 Uncharacterised protein [Providencia rustigianii]
MFLNKFNVASLLLVSTAFLAGCTANQSSTNTASMNSESKQAAVKTEPVAQEKSDNSYPESQNILNNALERSPNGLGKQGSEKSECVY